MEDLTKILEKYDLELKEDTKLDRFNLMDKQMQLPGIKHKWVARLINHKEKLNKLKKIKVLAKQKLMNELQNSEVVAVSKIVLDKKAEADGTIRNIESQIENEELAILYLEKVENVLRTMSYDIKNLVDLIKIEET